MTKRIIREGWGLACRATMAGARPETLSDLAPLSAMAGPRGILALGRGRSYGDAALNGDGMGILSERLDRLLAFDMQSGLLEAEAGVTMADLLRIFLPRGWTMPVIPGTGEVSLGGAVASDVHGKNHESAGSFGRHVAWFDLLLADGSQRRVSPGDELFCATIGGMGLTGMILRLGLRLARVPSAAILMRERRCPDLTTLFAVLTEMAAVQPYSVAWVDGMAGGASLGRGIAQSGDFAPAGTSAGVVGTPLTVPPLPLALACRASVGPFNEVYYRRAPDTRERVVAAEAFFHPLDGLARWNRLYGRRGFHQFQCVLPEADAPERFARMLQLAQAQGCPPFLTVLKAMGEAGEGMLSFPMRGWTLAMDFPATAKAAPLLVLLAEMTAEAGGRIYLAKDATLPAALLPAMYPHLDRFRAVLASVDPHHRWQSDLARRLNLKP